MPGLLIVATTRQPLKTSQVLRNKDRRCALWSESVCADIRTSDKSGIVWLEGAHQRKRYGVRRFTTKVLSFVSWFVGLPKELVH